MTDSSSDYNRTATQATASYPLSPPFPTDKPKCKFKKGDYLMITHMPYNKEWVGGLCYVQRIDTPWTKERGYSIHGIFVNNEDILTPNGSWYENSMIKVPPYLEIKAVFRECLLKQAREERKRKKNYFKKSKDPKIQERKVFENCFKEDEVICTPRAVLYPMQASEHRPIWESGYGCKGIVIDGDGSNVYVKWENGAEERLNKQDLTRTKEGFYSKMERSLEPRIIKVCANVHDILMGTLKDLEPSKTFPPCFLLGSHPKKKDYIIDVERIETNTDLGGCWGMPQLGRKQLSLAQVALAKRGAAPSGVVKIGTTIETEDALSTIGKQGLFMLQIWKQPNDSGNCSLGLWVQEWIPQHKKTVTHKYAITKTYGRR